VCPDFGWTTKEQATLGLIRVLLLRFRVLRFQVLVVVREHAELVLLEDPRLRPVLDQAR